MKLPKYFRKAVKLPPVSVKTMIGSFYASFYLTLALCRRRRPDDPFLRPTCTETNSIASNTLGKVKIGGIFPKIASDMTSVDSLYFNSVVSWLVESCLTKKSANR